MPQKIRLPEQNSVTIIGRLASDPVLRYTQKGQGVCHFDVAVNRSYKDSNGEWQKEVSFIPVVVWRDAAVRCNERLKKGSPVFVSGRLKNRSWEDKAGQKRSTLEIDAQRVQFLQAMGDDAGDDEPGSKPSPGKSAVAASDAPVESAGEEEVPF